MNEEDDTEEINKRIEEVRKFGKGTSFVTSKGGGETPIEDDFADGNRSSVKMGGSVVGTEKLALEFSYDHRADVLMLDGMKMKGSFIATIMRIMHGGATHVIGIHWPGGSPSQVKLLNQNINDALATKKSFRILIGEEAENYGKKSEKEKD